MQLSIQDGIVEQSHRVAIGEKFILVEHLGGNTLPTLFQKMPALAGEDGEPRYCAVILFSNSMTEFPLNGSELVIRIV